VAELRYSRVLLNSTMLQKALFKKEERLRDGQKAMAEYEAAQRAVREQTARLRALRLARDAAAKPSVPSEKRAGATRPGGR
jgi:hypothetical protein